MELKIEGTPKIQHPQDTYEIIHRLFYARHKEVDTTKEHFWTLALDAGLKILAVELVSMGGRSRITVDPPHVLRVPLYKAATSMVLVHNHPSGNLAPSEADLNITNRLIQAALIMDIDITDHLIITPKSFFSFAMAGLIEKLRWDRKYALTFVRDKQVAKEVAKIKREAEQLGKQKLREGQLKGLIQGEEQGRKKERMELAKMMLLDGESLEKIGKYTGIPRNWLGRLQREIEEER